MERMIDLLLVTWPNHRKRIEYFRRTVEALRNNLSASRHLLRWACSAESEHDPAASWHGDELTMLCREWGIEVFWRDEEASLGANMNAAARLARGPIYFLVQDDWELLYPLDLSPGAEFMALHPGIDILRYSYYQHPEHGTQFAGDLDGWRLVNMDGYWPYGDDPQMRHAIFHRRWGWYLEGGRHGMSEGDMLARLVHGGAKIAAADRSYFGHFGEVAAVPVSQEYRERAVSR